MTPLSEAAGAGNAAMIEALLNAGADARTLTTPDGETVLMTAARTGNVDAVKILLSHGADVNAKESYRRQTALMWAAAEHHAEVVKVLLDHGADWKPQSLARETTMPKLSAASSITAMARGGLTAFHFAAREGDIETGRVMLDAGVDINQLDADNTSALVTAIMNKRYTYAKFLLDKGADPNWRMCADARRYTRPSICAIRIIRLCRRTRRTIRCRASVLIKALLERGANPNAALTKNLPGRSGMDAGDTSLDAGTTPLMRAARAGDAAAMRALLAKGADPKLTTKDGNTALHVRGRRGLPRQEYQGYGEPRRWKL